MTWQPSTVHEPKPQPLGGLLSADQVADLLAVSRSMIYKLLRTGELPAVYVGRLPRFAEADILEFIATRRRTPEVSP
jgi:excisionase family DNA binding protein